MGTRNFRFVVDSEPASGKLLRLMKRFCVILILIADFCVPLRADLADGISAIVNDKIITVQEVNDLTMPAVEVLREEYQDQPDLLEQKLNDTFKDGLETLIEDQLILHEFETKYNGLPDHVVDEIVEERIKERFDGDRTICIKTLQGEGKTFEEFREEIRQQYIISALREKNISDEKIIISPYKVENYYLLHQDDFKVGDQVKLRMIVLTKTDSDDPSTRKMAGEILNELKKGASFAQLESVYSQDKQQQGSDWIETSVLREELADTVATLKPGQNSSVIETPDNCYILHLDDRRPAHVKPLADVHLTIEATLRTQAQKDAQQRWIDSLKKKAFIQLFD
jgi:peptidyl-prolyl cis-trans isomerase SurA